MAIVDLYSTGEHRRNLAHFAAMASLAAVDGVIGPEEGKLLDRFARILDITDEEYREVLKKDNIYPFDPPLGSEQRLERLYDLFRVIFVDQAIDDQELSLVTRYAIGLGYSSEKAQAIIKRSVDIFSGRIDFDGYQYLIGE